MICACVCSSFCKLPVLAAWNSKYLLVDVSVCVFSWVFCAHYGSKGEFSLGKCGLLLAPGKTEKSHLLLQLVVNPICSEFSLFLLLSPPPPPPLPALFFAVSHSSSLPVPSSPLPLEMGLAASSRMRTHSLSGSKVQHPWHWAVPLPIKCYMDWGLPPAWSVVRFFTSSLPGQRSAGHSFFFSFFTSVISCARHFVTCNCHVSSYVFENNKMDASVDAKKRKEKMLDTIYCDRFCACVFSPFAKVAL